MVPTRRPSSKAKIVGSDNNSHRPKLATVPMVLTTSRDGIGDYRDASGKKFVLSAAAKGYTRGSGPPHGASWLASCHFVVKARDKGAGEDGRSLLATSPNTNDIQETSTKTPKDKEVCGDATPSRNPVDQDEQRGATICVRNGRPRSKGPRHLPVPPITRNLPQLLLKPDGLPQILRRKIHHPPRHHGT